MTAAVRMLATAPVIKVAGTELPAADLDRLVGLRISKTFRLPSRSTLSFDDPGFTVASGTRFGIGVSVEVLIATEGTIFKGEVTGVDLRVDSGVPQFTVVADDLGYKLTLGTKLRTFTEVSYSDIVATIAREAGLQSKVDSLSDRLPYVLQADSDYGLLCEIADRVGYDWWVEDRTLNFRKPVQSAGPTLTLGEGLIQFRVKATALHPASAKVNGWDRTRKQAISATATVSAGSEATLVKPFIQASSLTSTGATLTGGDTVMTDSEARLLADRQVALWKSGAVTAQGLCLADHRVVLGGTVTVASVGPAAGDYVVTEVEHTYGQAGFRTRFVAGQRRPGSLVDRLAGASEPSSFRRGGLVVGVVTGVGNPEGSPAEVKVKFPGADDTLESAWARVVSVGGGNARGIVFTPEVNDEVVVGFEGGDLRRPVVLGGLFNSKDSAPVFKSQNGAVGTRVIMSRVGHSIEFGDGSGDPDQYIGLTLAGGHHQVKLGKQELTAVVPSGTPIKLTSGQSFVEIADDGSITLSGKKITLKSQTDVDISGLNITAKASVKTAIGGATVEVKANAQAEVTAGGPVSIKGATVMVN